MDGLLCALSGAECTAELHQSGIVGTPWDMCEEACKGEHLFQCDYSSQGNLIVGFHLEA